MDSSDQFASDNFDFNVKDLENSNLSLFDDSFKHENTTINSIANLDNHQNNSITDLIDLTKNEIIPNEDLTNLNEDILTSIARSAFADMLWDQERNYLYKKAIKKVLTNLLESKQNEKINLLDIGAGSGLLSMFMYKTISDFLIDHPNLNKDNIKIIALEQFFYSYLSAKEIISLNKMNDKIDLHYKSSLVEILDKNDLCDFLATEVFDTELIGEGALEIFRDAKKKLLKENSLIVPRRARVYCQLIESKFLTDGHVFRSIRIKDDKSNTILLNHSDEINNCPGSCAQLNDMQLNSLNINDFKIISDVKMAFEIDFQNPPNNSLDSKKIGFKILSKAKKMTNVCVAVWWDLDMDQEGEIVLSCAPYWARNDVNYDRVITNDLIDDVSSLFKFETGSQFDGKRDIDKELNKLKDHFSTFNDLLNKNKNLLPSNVEQNFEKLRISSQWRDHWMQAVYFLPKDSLKNPIIEQDLLEIMAFRNDYQFWFNYQNPYSKGNKEEKFSIQPACVCGYHRVYSRNQIRQINDHQTINVLAINFNQIYEEFKLTIQNKPIDRIMSSSPNPSENLEFQNSGTKKFKKNEDVCNIFVNGGMGIFPLIIAKLVPNSIIYLFKETDKIPFYKEIIYKERLDHKFLGVTNLFNFDIKIDILIKDLCTDLDKLPWLDLHDFLLTYRSLLAKQIPLVLPSKIIFKVMPVCFDHLWKFRYVIKKIDDLDLSPFSKMVDRALEIESRKIEMYSLHEYDSIALDNPQAIASINVANMDSYKGQNTINFNFNLENIKQRLLDLNGLNYVESKRSVFDQQLKQILPFKRSLTNIAFVIWPEYSRLVNTGLFSSVKIDYSSKVIWNKTFKQAVYFMPEFNRDYLDEVSNLKIGLNLTYDFNRTQNIFNFTHKDLSSDIN